VVQTATATATALGRHVFLYLVPTSRRTGRWVMVMTIRLKPEKSPCHYHRVLVLARGVHRPKAVVCSAFFCFLVRDAPQVINTSHISRGCDAVRSTGIARHERPEASSAGARRRDKTQRRGAAAVGRLRRLGCSECACPSEWRSLGQNPGPPKQQATERQQVLRPSLGWTWTCLLRTRTPVGSDRVLQCLCF
jgi:hypothetical protein